MLCALDLKDRGHDVSLYTQGQPRVGTPAFANYVVGTKIPYQRLVHKRDSKWICNPFALSTAARD